MEKIITQLNGVHLSSLLSTIGVGLWDWELPTGKVVYSTAWANILGYTVEELPQVVDTWERMVLPEDLAYANGKIECHLSGLTPTYEAEFRMVCKDGSIIWAQDKGQVTEYDAQGKPLRFVGVLQNVSRLKHAELSLLEKQASLDLAVGIAQLGTWDWDILGNVIHYNDEYLKMLGYSKCDVTGSMEEWEARNHPEDLSRASQKLNAYLAGEAEGYECEIRMLRKDGTYIWTRDVGKIVERDAQGKPTRVIGGHLNIDGLKRSEERLTEALEALEHSNLDLEQQVETRTLELVEQDKMLWTVNQISKGLLASRPEDNFDELVQDCLRQLGESLNRNRVYIWKDRIGAQGKMYCTQIYEWVRGVAPIQGNAEYEEIPYEDLPSFNSAIDEGKCLNSLIRALSESEQAVLGAQGIKTILIAPVVIHGKRWGFIGVDNCESEALFTSMEETMLLMSGSMLANTIDKMETQAQLREVEERTQLMLDAMPLCCNLWTPELINMHCNEEAVRLFGLPSQEEYLKHFFELSPEFQPCGKRSDELSRSHLMQAFEKGYWRFEWVHRKLDGTLIPAEITLVRIKYKGGFIVAGYTRDLREFKAILTQLQSKEEDLRGARDEALLSSKAKSNFLANMSHEIRTPMNAISGLAEIIARESEGHQTAELAKGIQSACSSLLNIINDILDISKIESGKLEIFHSQYELASLLNDAITISRMRLGSKPLMFLTDIDSSLPAQLIGDEIRIKQVLINLLSNAIKFTNKGYIALRVSSSVEGDKAVLRFSVKDSGVGIKPEDLERLFAEFERVNTTKNRSIEGTGLGLAISRQLCEMMEGTIEVRSEYAIGSEFIATIPQLCPDYQPLSQVKEKQNVLLYEPRALYRHSIAQSLENLGCTCIACENQSQLYDHIDALPYGYILTAALYLKKVQAIVKKQKLPVQVAVFANYNEPVSDESVYTMLFPINCLQLADLLNGQNGGAFSAHSTGGPSFVAPTARVLVVDDNLVNLRVAQGLMAPYEFPIDTAENGLEAIAKVQSTQYDLVFMDHMMPEMDGIDATIAIRRLDEDYYKNIPIVALTANALVGTREMFMREGMNDFLAKPIEINKLNHVLEKWLPAQKQVQILPKAPSTMPAEAAQPIIIAGVNTAKGVQAVGGSQENYLQILAAFYEDGIQKCDSLAAHLMARNLAAFRTEVHAVKSTAATIGAPELSAMAARLEAAAQAGDFAVVEHNTDDFLAAFRKILGAIRPVLATLGAAHPPANKAAPKGEVVKFKKDMQALQEAAEIANIGAIEALMKQLEGFAWPKELASGLTEIQKALSLFDYDAVLEWAQKLQQTIE